MVHPSLGPAFRPGLGSADLYPRGWLAFCLVDLDDDATPIPAYQPRPVTSPGADDEGVAKPADSVEQRLSALDASVARAVKLAEAAGGGPHPASVLSLLSDAAPAAAYDVLSASGRQPSAAAVTALRDALIRAAENAITRVGAPPEHVDVERLADGVADRVLAVANEVEIDPERVAAGVAERLMLADETAIDIDAIADAVAARMPTTSNVEQAANEMAALRLELRELTIRMTELAGWLDRLVSRTDELSALVERQAAHAEEHRGKGLLPRVMKRRADRQ